MSVPRWVAGSYAIDVFFGEADPHSAFDMRYYDVLRVYRFEGANENFGSAIAVAIWAPCDGCGIEFFNICSTVATQNEGFNCLCIGPNVTLIGRQDSWLRRL